MSMSNSQEVLTSTSGAKKRSRVRIVILLLLSVGTMINYLDRTILGIVAPQLSKEIHIDPAMMGIIFSAFAWTYALAQIPGGMFLDRFGNKVTYALSIFFWSLFTLLQSFTLGLKSLLLLRLGLGVSEAPCFPANSRIVSTWFPQHERARATATYTVGEYIGLAAFSPLLFLILEHHGWRTLFFLTGGIFNFCANMASIIAPLIIGVIISATGNFFYALIYVGLTALIGVIAYIFIIGDIKRIELK